MFPSTSLLTHIRSWPPPQATIQEGSTTWDLDDKLAAAGGLDMLAAALRRADVRASLTELRLG